MPCPFKIALIAAAATLVLVFQFDCSGWGTYLSEAKDKTLTRKVLYYGLLLLIAILHLEFLSGGMLCRMTSAAIAGKGAVVLTLLVG